MNDIERQKAVVESLAQELAQRDEKARALCAYIVSIVREQAWHAAGFKTFKELLEAPLSKGGLNSSIIVIFALARHDATAHRALLSALRPKDISDANRQALAAKNMADLRRDKA